MPPRASDVFKLGKDSNVKAAELNDETMIQLPFFTEWHVLNIFLLTVLANALVHEINPIVRHLQNPDSFFAGMCLGCILVSITPLYSILYSTGSKSMDVKLSVLSFIFGFFASFFMLSIPNKIVENHLEASYTLFTKLLNERFEEKDLNLKFTLSWDITRLIISVFCGIISTASFIPAKRAAECSRPFFRSLKIESSFFMKGLLLYTLFPLLTWLTFVRHPFSILFESEMISPSKFDKKIWKGGPLSVGFVQKELRIYILIICGVCSLFTVRNQVTKELFTTISLHSTAAETKWSCEDDKVLQFLIAKAKTIPHFMFCPTLQSAFPGVVMLSFAMLFKNYSNFTFSEHFFPPQIEFTRSGISQFMYSVSSWLCFWFLLNFNAVSLSIFAYYNFSFSELKRIVSI